MPATPNITLTAKLETILGGATLNGYLEITLCAFGPVLPRVIGTAMLANAGVPQLEGPNNTFSVQLFGNDQISPDGTFYSIAVLDENKEVIQVNNYQLLGSGTVDLSTLAPIDNPSYSTPSGYFLNSSASGLVTIDSAGWTGPIVIDLTLIADITLVLNNLVRGQIVQFIFRQDAIGAWSVTWPAKVKNPALINGAATAITTMSFVVDYAGNLYPQLGWS